MQEAAIQGQEETSGIIREEHNISREQMMKAHIDVIREHVNALYKESMKAERMSRQIADAELEEKIEGEKLIALLSEQGKADELRAKVNEIASISRRLDRLNNSREIAMEQSFEAGENLMRLAGGYINKWLKNEK